MFLLNMLTNNKNKNQSNGKIENKHGFIHQIEYSKLSILLSTI